MCPALAAHEEDGGNFALWRNESMPSSYQPNWQRCFDCAVLFSGLGSHCPKTGDTHRPDDADRYALRREGPWHHCGRCKALFNGPASRCPATGDVHVSDGSTFAVDPST